MPRPTPLHERTAPLCVSYRWKEWAGYVAPCQYDTNHEVEYHAFRHAAGLLDVSPLKKYDVRGADAARLLSYVMTRDVAKLAAGRVGYGCFCDEQGKVIDDGTVARLGEDRYRVTAASPLLWWLRRHAPGLDVEVADASETTAALALQGPTSREVLRAASDANVDKLRFFGITGANVGRVPVEITRTGYTGDLGYEVWVDADRAIEVWDTLMDAGAPLGLAPVGLDALDMTRVEAGFVLQDVDYFSAPLCTIESRKSTPFELGLGWTVHLDRAAFSGQAALRREQERGSKWALVGLELAWDELEELYAACGLPPRLADRAWRTAVPVFDGPRQVGQATSGTWSPICKKALALATVEQRHAKVGTALRIEHTVEYRRQAVTATVVDRPFYDPERKRKP
ncbi:MAG: aminomethyltransferase family protein [Planctomycetota bacterium]